MASWGRAQALEADLASFEGQLSFACCMTLYKLLMFAKLIISEIGATVAPFLGGCREDRECTHGELVT